MARDPSAQLRAYFALHLSIGLNFRLPERKWSKSPPNVSVDLVCRHDHIGGDHWHFPPVRGRLRGYQSDNGLAEPTAAISDQRSLRRQSNLRCAALRPPVVWRAKRDQQRNRLREVLQPFTRCRDSGFRRGTQRDRDARAQEQF